MEIDPPAFPQSADTSTLTGTSIPIGIVTSNIGLDTFPRKRPLHQDDPFFQEGTYEYKAAWLRLEDANAYIPDLNEPEDTTNRTKAFPGEKWLVLHIREIHDVLVRIQRERGERTYQCYVDGCDRACSTPQKRRMHLIDKHQYPKHFNFSIVVTGVIPSTQRTAYIQKQNHRDAKKQEQQKMTQHQHKGQQQAQHIKDHDMADELSMDVEQTTNSVQGPKAAITNRRKSATPEPSSITPLVAAPRAAKKNAFQQYRGPAETKTKPSARRTSVAHDHTGMDIDVPLTPSASEPVSIASKGSSSVDMDMDQLQLSMSRLMIPRSVAKKMAVKPRTSTTTIPVVANIDNGASNNNNSNSKTSS
ncbi:hypothetical protein BGX24_011386 [Mortierella sp. AD032]|nr:hypothetical protein BGX24_011386 [Mortierella sp. AD032]